MKGCERNMAPAYEDTSPFRIAYRPCGKPIVVDVRYRGGVACMCEEHAREADLEGCEVDWPDEDPKKKP